MPKTVQTTTQLHSFHASKVVLKIIQAKLQQYMNRELPDDQAGFRKSRGTRDQIPNIRWTTEKSKSIPENIYLGLIDYSKAFDSVVVVAQSCPTLCNPMDCSPPGSSIYGIFQARVLEWAAISFSRASSRSRDRTWVSHIVDRCFTVWATREVLWQCRSQQTMENSSRDGNTRPYLLCEKSVCRSRSNC